MQKALVEILDLQISFQGNAAVKGLNFRIEKGEILAVVGESGSGKSVSSLAMMGLLPKKSSKVKGSILFHGDSTLSLLSLNDEDMRKVRGKSISMIFQEPMTSLNPFMTCGEQVTEFIQLHENCSKKIAKDKCLRLFEKVKLPRAIQLLNSYPHELSGGQRQRVMIAMAIACKPQLLIADEPTTALDVTVQKSILDLLKELQEETGMSILFITHDLGVVKDIADRVLVMHKGDLVEQGGIHEIFQNPKNAYTKGLLACRPSIEKRLKHLPTVKDFLNQEEVYTEVESYSDRQKKHQALYKSEPILKVKNLEVWFPQAYNWLGKPSAFVKAVNNISFEVYKGETLGLIGESGCGKSSLGRTLIGLNAFHSGEVIYRNNNISSLSKKEWKAHRRSIQFIFQDPYSSLNPKQKIGEAITEPMLVHGLAKNKSEAKKRAEELLIKVGLLPEHFNRYAHEFSGGQRQRIGIARALAMEPELIICDESVSALDVSVQAQVLNLLNDLKQEFGLTYIFISHDMSVVKHMSDRLLVMNKGKIEEYGESDAIYQNPKSAFTRNLLKSIPGA